MAMQVNIAMQVTLTAALLLRAGALKAAFDFNENVSVVPWAEARLLAQHAVSELSPSEKGMLIHGSKSYQLGWYVGNTQAIPRLSLPALTMADGGSGFRPLAGASGGTIMWPSTLALAATWDESLVQQVAEAMGQEFRQKGANVMLGPSINVHRRAFSGKNFEYLSGEDPYLGSRLVRPFVRGVQSQGVIAVAKHFPFSSPEPFPEKGTQQLRAADPEGVKVDAKTAWEIYYPPFAAAVDEGVGALMCSNVQVNGEDACRNSNVLLRDLKTKMGFQGFVMSDFGAPKDSDSVAFGLDQDMPGHVDPFTSALEITSDFAKENNEAALRILSAMYHVGLHKRWSVCIPPNCLTATASNVRTVAHQKLAHEVAAKSITLLKNKGLLPLNPSKVKVLAVVGAAASRPCSKDPLSMVPDFYAGGGSPHVNAVRVSTPLEGIQKRAQEAGVQVVVAATNDPTTAYSAVVQADATLVVAATSSTEGLERESLSLSENVDSLISMVAPLKPTAVLMQVPGAVVMPWRHNVSAIASLFLGGEETGRAWASMIFGDQAPEGRLPIMMPATADDVISRDGSYSESLFTSYRSKVLKAAFPFGHGLSYTHFEYSKPSVFVAGCGGVACIRMKVTNAGKRMGRDVPQAYVQFPASASEPDLVLKEFRKTEVLAPGESAEVTFSFSAMQLSTFSEGVGWTQHHDVKVHVGASSKAIHFVMSLAPSADVEVQTPAVLVSTATAKVKPVAPWPAAPWPWRMPKKAVSPTHKLHA